MACDGLSFLGICCPVPDVGNIYLVWNEQCMRYRYCIHPTAQDVSVQKAGGVPDLGTESLWGASGREWKTRLLHDGPLLDLCFNLVCKFGIAEMIFFTESLSL